MPVAYETISYLRVLNSIMGKCGAVPSPFTAPALMKPIYLFINLHFTI